MGLAGNVDSLEDDDAGLDDVSLDSESELWSDGIEISSSAAYQKLFFWMSMVEDVIFQGCFLIIISGFSW